MSYEKMLSPIRLRGLELKNRVLLPGMATNMTENGTFVSQRLIDYHAARAAGGCGLNIVEAASVHKPTACRGFLSIADDEHMAGMKRLTDAIHAAGGKACIQLWQGGMIPPTYDTDVYGVFPDAIYNSDGKDTPVEIIHEIVEAFGSAAKRCVEAGFDCLEFHCGHCYSPHAFLSPGLNKRTDEYGGSPENCMRYPLEIIRSIRANMPEDMPLFMRVTSLDDFLEGGYDIDYMVEYIKRAKEAGVDIADCSRGNFLTEAVDYEVPSINLPRGFNVSSAAKIRAGADIPSVAVGRINDPDQIEKILESGEADMVAVGRGQIADPQFVNKCAEGRTSDLTRCVACNQGCYDSILNPERPHITCLQNPSTGREAEFAAKLADKPAQPKTVLIVGGGMGGMEAAEILRQRGHRPVIVDKADHLGGKFILAGAAPRKEEMAVAAKDRARQTLERGIEVRLGTEVTAELLDELKPDHAVIASGGTPVKLRIPGADGENVYAVEDVLAGKIDLSGGVAIIGGGLVGLEAAELLAEKEGITAVTVVEMAAQCGADLGASRRNGVFGNLKAHGVKLLTRSTCKEIRPDAVCYERKGEDRSFECEKVVMAVGSKPQDQSVLISMLDERGIAHETIGDALQCPRRAIDAVREGANIALEI